MLKYLIGIELPKSIQKQLASICYGMASISWEKEGSFHIPLRDLGELSENSIADIKESLQTIYAPPFQVSLQHLDYFSSKNGAGEFKLHLAPSEPVIKLKKIIDKSLMELHLPLIEKSFKPFVLLGKGFESSSERIADYLSYHSLYQSDPIIIETFDLFSIQLTPKNKLLTSINKYSFTDVQDVKRIKNSLKSKN